MRFVLAFVVVLEADAWSDGVFGRCALAGLHPPWQIDTVRATGGSNRELSGFLSRSLLALSLVVALLAVLDQLDLIALGRIDECDHTTGSGLGRSIAQRIAFRGRVFSECFQIVHLESEVSDVRANVYRAALIKFTKLNFFLTAGRLQEHQLRAARRSVPA